MTTEITPEQIKGSPMVICVPIGKPNPIGYRANILIDGLNIATKSEHKLILNFNKSIFGDCSSYTDPRELICKQGGVAIQVFGPLANVTIPSPTSFYFNLFQEWFKWNKSNLEATEVTVFILNKKIYFSVPVSEPDWFEYYKENRHLQESNKNNNKNITVFNSKSKPNLKGLRESNLIWENGDFNKLIKTVEDKRVKVPTKESSKNLISYTEGFNFSYDLKLKKLNLDSSPKPSPSAEDALISGQVSLKNETLKISEFIHRQLAPLKSNQKTGIGTSMTNQKLIYEPSDLETFKSLLKALEEYGLKPNFSVSGLSHSYPKTVEHILELD